MNEPILVFPLEVISNIAMHSNAAMEIFQPSLKSMRIHSLQWYTSGFKHHNCCFTRWLAPKALVSSRCKAWRSSTSSLVFVERCFGWCLGCFGCRISYRRWGNLGAVGDEAGIGQNASWRSFLLKGLAGFHSPRCWGVVGWYGPNKATACCRGSLGSPGQDWMTWRQGATDFLLPQIVPGTRGSRRSGPSSAEVACHGNGRGGFSLGFKGWIVFVEVRRWKKMDQESSEKLRVWFFRDGGNHAGCNWKTNVV